MSRRLLLLAAAMLLSPFSAAPAGAATDAGGQADFAIASRTAKILKREKVKMTVTGGSASRKKLTLPVVSGSTNGALLSGTVKFKSRKKVVRLKNLTLDNSQGLIYATVDGMSVPFFLVDGAKSKQEPDGLDTEYGPYRVKLSAIGGSVMAARLGARIGTGGAFATLRVTLQTAATRVAFDPAFTAALQAGGLTAAPATPAVAATGGMAFSVTNAKGKVSPTAPISHEGGITITSPTASLTVTSFVIDPAAGTVSASGPSGTIPMFLVDESAAKTSRRGKQLTISGLKLVLTPEAAQALNTTFGLTSFASGAPVGKATVVGLR